MRRMEQRGDCPVCGYKNAYTETIARNGKRIGWCASCQNKEAIAAHLKGVGGYQPKHEIIKNRSEKILKAKERARIIWDGAEPIKQDDPAGRYLARRGIWWSEVKRPDFRYRADCPHPDGKRYPAMLARILDAEGNPQGVHRTFLTLDGKKAALETVKASLGSMWGNSIWVRDGSENSIWARCGSEINWKHVVVAEGIESAASASIIFDLPGISAISAGNLASGLALPTATTNVIIAADNDKPGLVAAETAKHRWQAEGKLVRIFKGKPGQDFNDILLENMGSAQ